MTTAANKPGLYTALLAVQKNAPGLVKDATNPHFNNRFVSLDGLLSQVRPLLSEQGIVLTQRPTVVANGDGLVPALKTTLVHAASGEELSDTMLLLLDKDNPQGQGSALTYARRYALMSMLALAGEEDDDGQRASRQQTRTQASDGDGNGRGRSSFVAPIEKAEREKLLAEFKDLQKTLARQDKAWTKVSLLSHCSAQAGETFNDFDELPDLALQQLVDAGREMIRGALA